MGTAGRVYVVSEQPNPSSDFFVLPAVYGVDRQVVKCGFDEVPSPCDLEGGVVIFVRYVPPTWVRPIAAVRSRLRALVMFLDDDVLDVNASKGMPLRYRVKLAWFAAMRSGWLKKQGAEFWVSTPYLRQKYSAWEPKLVLPSPLPPTYEYRRVFYHGTASHGAEIRWLRDVVAEVLRRDERIAFEIVGGPEVNRLYRGLSRVNVVLPMKWPAYQAFLATPGRHIGLAPLLDIPFNRARSYTKFFDITRAGAVGVYASGSECAATVLDGVDGRVVVEDRAAWVDAILHLAADETARRQMLANAERRMGELTSLAQAGYGTLLE